MLAREKVAFYLEDLDTSLGLGVNLSILILILVSSLIFVLETYNISDFYQTLFHRLDQIILVIFCLEYLLRLWCAPDRLKFIFSLFSLIDLIAILPLFLGIFDLRFIRIFRWFRVLRLIRFLDLEILIFRIQTEDGIALAKIFLTLFSLVFVYSGLIYQIENAAYGGKINNFFDALYFSIVTMTTVGYGDVTPLSQNGKIVTLIMIITGVLLIPWQLSELVKQIVKTTNKVKHSCKNCGLLLHDSDALFCKKCGNQLESL